MRLTKHRTGNSKPRTASRTPLAEGIIPLDKRGRRSWSSVSDDDLVSYAKTFMEENGITGRHKLEKADGGLYIVLQRRKLLDELVAKRKQRKGRPWKKMKDGELIEYAKKFMKKNGINRKTELSMADSGLYEALRKRGLLDRTGFEEKRRKQRPWKKMGNEELIGQAKKFMKERGIGRRGELQKADEGLYIALRKRKLLDRVGFEDKQRKFRPWKEMKDGEIIGYARKFMKVNGIRRRKELQKADNGLYSVLYKRKLLNLVFSDIEQSQSEKAIEQIIDFTAEFGERG